MAPRDIDKDDGTEPTKKKKGEDVYNSAARRVARCIDLWCDLDHIIKIVQLLQQEDASKYGDLDEDDAARAVREESLAQISAESREHATRTYYKIIQIVPSLKNIAEDPNRTAELARICSTMGSVMRGTRSSDANHLKKSIAWLCAPNPHDPSSLNPPVPSTTNKSELGLNHPILARWLCPADELGRFDADPVQARQDLASGVISMKAENFPALFWSGMLPGADFNPNSMCDGLFKSYLLIRIARHIFLGPSFSVQSTGKKKRSGNAILNDVTTIEAEHIAYVCVQARFAISSRESWNDVDGELDYSEMYKSVINFIKTSHEAWKDDLIGWWNKEIFGNVKGRVVTPNPNSVGSSAQPMSTMARAQAQMKVHFTATAQGPPFPMLAASAASSAQRQPDTFFAALDPTLAASSSTQRPPNTSTSSSSRLSSSQNPATPVGIDTGSAAPTSSGTAKPSTVIATPQCAVPRAATPGSPLSEAEDVPLTPVTNKGKLSAKARGKRPAPPETEAVTNPGRAKRSRRCRK